MNDDILSGLCADEDRGDRVMAAVRTLDRSNARQCRAAGVQPHWVEAVANERSGLLAKPQKTRGNDRRFESGNRSSESIQVKSKNHEIDWLEFLGGTQALPTAS